MERVLLLWQIRWLLYDYRYYRQWWAVVYPDWAEYERRIGGTTV